MEKTLMLTAGTQQVFVSEVPTLIAKAITPKELGSTDRIRSIWKKTIPIDMPYEDEMIPSEPLTDSDWDFLDKVCALSELPFLRKGNEMNEISLAEWEQYEKAVKEFKPDWVLIPVSNAVLSIAETQVVQHLTDAIVRGDVCVFDQLTNVPLTLPIRKTKLTSAYIPVGDFTKYAETNFQLKVFLGGNKAGQPASAACAEVISVTKQQDAAILNWLNAHGYEPMQLPIEPSGKPGIKKACGDELCQNKKMFSSGSVYKTAWERLRANGETKVTGCAEPPA